MMRLGILLLGLLSFSVALFGQKTEKVRAEYTYFAPENVSVEEAKRIALERAKLQAVADAFGTIVAQDNATLVTNRNGQSNTDFFSVGTSEVKGEWIETIGEPKYQIMYQDNMLSVSVVVSGRIREVANTTIDYECKVLCNGTDLKHENTSFKNGDDLYLYFRSPVDGFLTVYLLDETLKTVYALLPYKYSSKPAFEVKHDEGYVLFSSKHNVDDGNEVDEYTMTCGTQAEYNTIFVIFSPNPFTKVVSSDSKELLPREVSFADFQKWLSKKRSQDNDLRVKKISITIQ